MIDKKRVCILGGVVLFLQFGKLGNLKLFRGINTKVRCEEGMFCFVIPLGVLVFCNEALLSWLKSFWKQTKK